MSKKAEQNDNVAVPTDEVVGLTPTEMIHRMMERLPKEDIGTLSKGYGDVSYLPIGETIMHMNERAGARWGHSDIKLMIVPMEKEKQNRDGSTHKYTSNEAVMLGYVSLYDNKGNVICQRASVGASDENLDNSVKTALAEFVKKGSNMLGLGNHLWTDISKTPKNAGPTSATPYQPKTPSPHEVDGMSQSNEAKITKTSHEMGLTTYDLRNLMREMTDAPNANSTWLFKGISKDEQDKRVDQFIAYISKVKSQTSETQNVPTEM